MRSFYDDAFYAVDQEDVRQRPDPREDRDVEQAVGEGSGRAEDDADHERRERPARVGEEVKQAAGQRDHVARSDVGQQGPGGGRGHPLGEEGDREEQDDERRRGHVVVQDDDHREDQPGDDGGLASNARGYAAAQHPVRPGTADHGADQRAQVRDDGHDAGLEQGEMLLLDQVVGEPGQEEEQRRGVRELADQRSEHALLAEELPDVGELRVATGLPFDVYRRHGTAALFDVLEFGLGYP